MPFFKGIAEYKSWDFSKLIFNKIYQGKPTLYLDQNILDKIVDYPILIEDDRFAGYNCQVIYSNETLNEIERSGKPDKFLKVLESIKARRMVFEVDKNFQITGAVIINPYINPFIVYKEYLSRDFVDEIASKIITNNMQFIFSLFSNETSNSISNYTNESRKSFDILHEKTLEVLESIKGDTLEVYYQILEESIRKNFEEQSIQFDVAQNSILDSMSNTGMDLETNSGHDGIRELEAVTGIDGKYLNNIKPPKVLEKIYQKYTNSSDTKHITDFYLLSDKIYGRNLYKFEKVMNVYMILNILGYKRDKGFHKKYRRLISSNSDGQHLSYACYCDFIFSEDKSFIDKARAIFDFLNIGTEVVKVNFNISYDNN